MRYALDFRARPEPNRPGPPTRLEGLEWDEVLNALALTRLPGRPVVLAARTAGAIDPSRQSAIACADLGRDTLAVFFASPAWGDGRLWRLEVEGVGDGSVSGPRPWPTDDGRFAIRPAGLAVGPRGLLAAALPDVGRVVLLDAATGQPRGEVLGVPDRPTYLAWDARGRLYVSGDGGLRRFNRDGRPDSTFAPGDPSGVAGPIAALPDRSVIVDRPGGLLRLDESGVARPWPGTTTNPLPLAFPEAAGRVDRVLGVLRTVGRTDDQGRAAALAVAGGRVEIALQKGATDVPVLHVLNAETLRLTAATPRVLALAPTPQARPAGCSGITGHLLALEVRGEALVVAAYDPRAGRVRRGSIRLGPLADDLSAPWRTLRVETAADWPVAVRTGLATLTTSPDDPIAPPADLDDLERTNPPPAPEWFANPAPPAEKYQRKGGPIRLDVAPAPVEPASADDRDLTPPGRWRRSADDVRESRLWHAPGDPRKDSQPLWAALFFRGDGAATPEILGLTITSGGPPWLSMLPAIYGRDLALGFGSDGVPASPDAPGPVRLLDGLLDLFASSLEERTAAIEALPDFFDTDETTDPTGLAGHLGLDRAGFPPDLLRSSLAAAWRASGERSTPGTLARSLKRELGVDARLVEPGARAGLWVLGETAGLGRETRLSAGSAGPATLDASAVLDGSWLGGDDPGEAYWGDGPSSLVVRVFEADVSRPGVLERLRTWLDDSTPAYLAPAVEVIGPRARVGRQAILGVNAVVARETSGMRPWRPPEPLGPGRRLTPARARPPRGRLPLRVGRDRIA